MAKKIIGPSAEILALSPAHPIHVYAILATNLVFSEVLKDTGWGKLTDTEDFIYATVIIHADM